MDDESLFRRQAKIFDFSSENAANVVDDNSVNEQLQQLGITDPNDVEELLDALTDEEKQHFLSMVGKGALEDREKEG